MCTVLLPPGVNPISVNIYININIYHTLSGVVGFLAPGASDHKMVNFRTVTIIYGIFFSLAR